MIWMKYLRIYIRFDWLLPSRYVCSNGVAFVCQPPISLLRASKNGPAVPFRSMAAVVRCAKAAGVLDTVAQLVLLERDKFINKSKVGLYI